MSDSLSSLGRAAYGGSVLSAIANPQVVNPLAAYSGAAETAGRIYQLRQAQAQQAIGGILQQATDENGNVDYPKANLLAAQAGPVVQMGMQTMLRGNSELRGQQQTQGLTGNAAMINAITAAQKAPDDQLPGAVADGIGRLIDNGIIPRNSGIAAALRLPTDPTALRARLEQMRISLLPPEEQRAALYGNLGTQTGPGGSTIGTTQQTSGPNAGAVSMPPQPGAPQGIPGVNLDGPYTYQDPKTGQPVTTTERQFLVDHGFTWAAHGGPGGAPGSLPSSLRNPNGPAAPSQPGSPASPSAAPATNTALPVPPTPPAQAPQQPVGNQGLVRNPDGSVGTPGGGFRPPATPQPGPAPVATGPAPADLEQQKQQAAQSATAFQTVSDQAVASRPRSAILGNMLGDTSQFTTGPLADVKSKIRNMAIQLGVKGDTEAQTASESFQKFAAGLANAQGAGSDARLNVNLAANPHMSLSPQGVDLMIRQLQGNEDYLQARGQQAASYGDQSNVKKFESEVGAKLDPRAFQFARMSVPQRQAYVKGLSDKDKAAVQSSYNWAVRQKIIGGG